MKPSSIIVAATCLVSSAFAAPAPEAFSKGGYGQHNKGTDKWGGKYKFTSTYSVVATPDQVVNTTETGENVFTGGLKGAIGYYDFAINSKKDIICYNIRLYGFRGGYQSAADTATHIHEAAKGENGPPRLAFPNPKKTGKGDERVSKGCLEGPFETGIISEDTGLDTADGFEVKEIEENPSGFFCDVHSSLAIPGAVRGQLA